MAPPVKEKEIKVLKKMGVIPPVEELPYPPTVKLPGERLTAGMTLKVNGLGVSKKDVVVVSPTLRVIGERLDVNVPMFSAAGVKQALKMAA